MKVKVFSFFLSMSFSMFCYGQKESVMKVGQQDFISQAKEYLDTCYSNGDSVIVLFDNGCCNGYYYFIFKPIKSCPGWVGDYVKESNKFLEVGDSKVPLITQMDYTFYYNQELSDSLGYYLLDGTILGGSDRFILVMTNDRGRFGRLVSKEELIEH
jgi:hypothetical protein